MDRDSGFRVQSNHDLFLRKLETQKEDRMENDMQAEDIPYIYI